METRRESAKQITRSALISASLELFNEQGFDGPSLDEICARAGYTRGAFYVHFKDREDLVAAVMGDALQNLLDRVIDQNPEKEQSLVQTAMQYIEAAVLPIASNRTGAGPRFHQFLEACHRSAKVRSIFLETIRQAISRVASSIHSGQERGELREDLPAEHMASVLVLLAMGALVGVDVGLDMKLDETSKAALRLFQKTPED